LNHLGIEVGKRNVGVIKNTAEILNGLFFGDDQEEMENLL
jgi:hypothetical protein